MLLWNVFFLCYTNAATAIVGFMLTVDLIEFDIKHAFSDFSRMRSAFAMSVSFFSISIGSNKTSDIKNLPSIFSSFPFEAQLKLTNSRLLASAIARNVVIKQLLTAAVK